MGFHEAATYIDFMQEPETGFEFLSRFRGFQDQTGTRGRMAVDEGAEYLETPIPGQPGERFSRGSTRGQTNFL